MHRETFETDRCPDEDTSSLQGYRLAPDHSFPAAWERNCAVADIPQIVNAVESVLFVPQPDTVDCSVYAAAQFRRFQARGGNSHWQGQIGRAPLANVPLKDPPITPRKQYFRGGMRVLSAIVW